MPPQLSKIRAASCEANELQLHRVNDRELEIRFTHQNKYTLKRTNEHGRGLAAKVNTAEFAVIRFPLMNSSHRAASKRGLTGSEWINQNEACAVHQK